jgi:hypothetical protein
MKISDIALRASALCLLAVSLVGCYTGPAYYRPRGYYRPAYYRPAYYRPAVYAPRVYVAPRPVYVPPPAPAYR